MVSRKSTSEAFTKPPRALGLLSCRGSVGVGKLLYDVSTFDHILSGGAYIVGALKDLSSITFSLSLYESH